MNHIVENSRSDSLRLVPRHSPPSSYSSSLHVLSPSMIYKVKGTFWQSWDTCIICVGFFVLIFTSTTSLFLAMAHSLQNTVLWDWKSLRLELCSFPLLFFLLLLLLFIFQEPKPSLFVLKWIPTQLLRNCFACSLFCCCFFHLVRILPF